MRSGIHGAATQSASHPTSEPTMKRLTPLLLVCAIFAAPTTANAQQWKAELKRDLVTVKDGKMVYSEVEICELKGQTETLDVRWNATAPAKGVISRDQFITFMNSFEASFVAQMMKARGLDYFDDVDCNPPKKEVEKVNMTISVTLDAKDIHVKMKTPGKEPKEMTMKWTDMFGD